MKIMLDAGHGYQTKGKQTVDGMKEYEFNRAVAYFAKQILMKFQEVKVFFPHSDDRDVSLKRRTYIANKLNVDLYVSIHANAYGDGKSWNDANGIETYIHPSRPKEAEELAKLIQRKLVTFTGRKDRGVKTADFHVLRETKMTAVLCECGFMTNQEEAKLLKTEEYQMKCAQAIAQAIIEYYQLTPISYPPVKKPLYKVQVGAFYIKENAEKLAEKLQKQGYKTWIVEK